MKHMIIGLPDSTFFIVFGSFAVAGCLLLVWALTFRSDTNAE
jgi:hypothetical protein